MSIAIESMKIVVIVVKRDAYNKEKNFFNLPETGDDADKVIQQAGCSRVSETR